MARTASFADTRPRPRGVQHKLQILAALIGETVLVRFVTYGEVEFPDMGPLAVGQDVADQNFAWGVLPEGHVERRIVPDELSLEFEAEMIGDGLIIQLENGEPQDLCGIEFVDQCLAISSLPAIEEMAGLARYGPPSDVLTEERGQVFQNRGPVLDVSEGEFTTLLKLSLMSLKAIFIY